MQKLAQLHNLIKRSVNLKITVSYGAENIKYNNYWVTDLSGEYFEETADEITTLLNDNINYDNKNNVNFLKSIFAYIKEEHDEQIQFDYTKNFELKNEKWDYELGFSEQDAPQRTPTDLGPPSPTRDDRMEIIFEIIRGFFNINDEDITEDRLNQLLKSEFSLDGVDLDMIYAKAHLSFIMNHHFNMVRKIAYSIYSLIDLMDSLEPYAQEYKITPNDAVIKFNLEKQDIAILFHTLHKLKIIQTNTDKIYDSQTQLKAFIDNSSIYYPHNNNDIKVSNINKQFTPLNNKEINDREIKFISELINKLQERIETIQARKKK